MLLACERVSFCYDPPTKRQQRRGMQPTYAVQSLSFTLEQGECLALTGPTGSGKSTLINLLCGLLQPTSGSITWRGTDLASPTGAAAARTHLGVALQYPERQLFATSVFDDIAFGPRQTGLSETEAEQRVASSLAQVELPYALAKSSPFALSGGEQRRVALAGILARKPDVLILDEPTAGLDLQAHESFLRLIQNIHAQGLTIMFASHDMNDISALATRVLVLNQGIGTFLGTPEELFVHHAPDLIHQGLVLPCAQQYAHELREAGIPLPHKLYSLEALADEIANIFNNPRSYESNES